MNDILSNSTTHQNDPRDKTAQDRMAQRVIRDRDKMTEQITYSDVTTELTRMS